MQINLTLEDLTPEFVKYSFIINNYIFHITVTNELTKNIEFISIANLEDPNLDEHHSEELNSDELNSDEHHSEKLNPEGLNLKELNSNKLNIDDSNEVTLNVTQNELSSNNIPQLDEKIAEQIYQKILWYKKLDNFFAKGFVNIT